MIRNLSAAVLAVALLANAATTIAQVRIRRDGGQSSSDAAGRIRESPTTHSATIRAEQPHPPTEARSTARLTFMPRDVDQRRVPSRVPIGLGGASFGYVPLWAWTMGVPPRTVALTVVPLQPLEGAPIGGIQLDIEPRRAQVYVDGAFVGPVSDFSGYYQHLDLVAGPHLITIIAPNYEPLIIEAIVPPGRTITYRGTLIRAYGR
jgi:hypothetical protein